jgi:hypothetical protein
MKSDRMKLIAARSLRYDTRRLQAGDEFEAPDWHARILVGIRKAHYAPDKPTPVVQPKKTEGKAEIPAVEPVRQAEVSQQQVGDLDSLRREAQRLGIEVDGRWGDIRLRHEIAQAKQNR